MAQGITVYIDLYCKITADKTTAVYMKGCVIMSFIENSRRAFSPSDSYDYDSYDSRYDNRYDDEEMDEYEDEPKKKGFLSFMSSLFGKNKENDEEYDQEDDEEEYEESIHGRSRSSRDSYSTSYRGGSGSSFRSSDISGTEVKVLYPTSFDDSANIVKEVKANKITIFDVSGISTNEDARRVVDYICGAAAGMDCPFSRLCPSIFCIAPKGVILSISKARYSG